jgi:hypothetical protein
MGKQVDMDAIRHLINNEPLDDFDGYTHNEMHLLIYNAPATDSPLELKMPGLENHLSRMPFLCLTEAFLQILQREGYFKLTALGRLPQKKVEELYSLRIILEDAYERGYTSTFKESHTNAIFMVRSTLKLAGLIKTVHGKLLLTKQGAKLLLPQNRIQLFKKIFECYTHDLPWSILDGYPEIPVGNFGWAYVITLLLKYGNHDRPAHFYAEKYAKAFPDLMEYFTATAYTSQHDLFYRCFTLRYFERFADWWGLVTLTEPEIPSKMDMLVTATPLLESLFLAR